MYIMYLLSRTCLQRVMFFFFFYDRSFQTCKKKKRQKYIFKINLKEHQAVRKLGALMEQKMIFYF